MILFAVIAPHTVRGKVGHTIARTQERGGDDTNTWGDRLQTLAHPFKQFHKILK